MEYLLNVLRKREFTNIIWSCLLSLILPARSDIFTIPADQLPADMK